MPETRHHKVRLRSRRRRSASFSSLVRTMPFLAGGDYFVPIEAEAGHVAEAAGLSPADGRTVALRHVFDHD